MKVFNFIVLGSLFYVLVFVVGCSRLSKNENDRIAKQFSSIMLNSSQNNKINLSKKPNLAYLQLRNSNVMLANQSDEKLSLVEKTWGSLSEGTFSSSSVSEIIAFALNQHVSLDTNLYFAHINAFNALTMNFNPIRMIVTTEFADKLNLKKLQQTKYYSLIEADLNPTEMYYASKEVRDLAITLDEQEIVLTIKGFSSEAYKNAEVPPIQYQNILIIDGFLSGLDPHSRLIPNRTFETISGSGDTDYKGIGAVFKESQKGVFVVDSVYKGSPADKAGLKYRDLIISVEDKDVSKISSKEFFEVIGNPEIKKIKLKILRTTENKSLVKSFKIKKELIEIRNVEVENLSDSKFIKLGLFSREAFSQIKEQISLKDKNIILDLRGNLGGDMWAAGRIIDLFVGSEISNTDPSYYRYREPLGIFDAQFLYPTGLFEKKKKDLKVFTKARDANLVVLIDNLSASASELVSSVFKHKNRAILIGENSYGKGTAQAIYPIEVSQRNDPSAFMAITDSFFYTYGHYTPQFIGVAPHIVTPKDIGESMDSDREIVAEKDLIGALVPPKRIDVAFEYVESDKIKNAKSCVEQNISMVMSEYILKIDTADVKPDYQLMLAEQAIKCLQ